MRKFIKKISKIKFLKRKQDVQNHGWDSYVSKKGIKYPNYYIRPLINYLPENIDTIIIIGCTNGRDFLPFINLKKYKLIGMDLINPDIINWIPDKTKINCYKN